MRSLLVLPDTKILKPPSSKCSHTKPTPTDSKIPTLEDFLAPRQGQRLCSPGQCPRGRAYGVPGFGGVTGRKGRKGVAPSSPAAPAGRGPPRRIVPGRASYPAARPSTAARPARPCAARPCAARRDRPARHAHLQRVRPDLRTPDFPAGTSTDPTSVPAPPSAGTPRGGLREPPLRPRAPAPPLSAASLWGPARPLPGPREDAPSCPSCPPPPCRREQSPRPGRPGSPARPALPAAATCSPGPRGRPSRVPAPLACPPSPPAAARGRPRPAPRTPHFRAEGAAPPLRTPRPARAPPQPLER